MRNAGIQFLRREALFLSDFNPRICGTRLRPGCHPPLHSLIFSQTSKRTLPSISLLQQYLAFLSLHFTWPIPSLRALLSRQIWQKSWASVASGIAVGQLATHIITSCEKLYNFWGSVKGAPKNVTDLLDEIKLLAKELEKLSQDGTGAQESQLLVQKTMVELRNLLSELETGMEKERGRTRGAWGRVKAAVKYQEIGNLVARLERTKSTLTIAVMAYHTWVLSSLLLN